MQGESMTDGTSFTIRGDNNNPAKGLQLFGKGLQACGVNSIIIGE
jgi:hypothetical protein